MVFSVSRPQIKLLEAHPTTAATLIDPILLKQEVASAQYCVSRSTVLLGVRRSELALTGRCSTAPTTLFLFHNVGLKRSNNREKLFLLFRRNIGLLQRCYEVVDHGIELGLSDAQASVRLLGWAADDRTRTARDVANQVLVLLNEHLSRIGAHGTEELGQLGIVQQPSGKVLHHRRNRVVPSKPRIQRRAL